jgi:hypothetical protein
MRRVVSDVWPAREKRKNRRKKQKKRGWRSEERGVNLGKGRGLRIRDGNWFSNCHSHYSPVAGFASGQSGDQVDQVSMATRSGCGWMRSRSQQ